MEVSTTALHFRISFLIYFRAPFFTVAWEGWDTVLDADIY